VGDIVNGKICIGKLPKYKVKAPVRRDRGFHLEYKKWKIKYGLDFKLSHCGILPNKLLKIRKIKGLCD